MSSPLPQAVSYVRQDDGDLEALMLAACLTALGIPFSERPAFALAGDARPCVNWLFDEQSPDGKYKASECIAHWNDRAWIENPDNAHPLAFMAAAMRNLLTLVRHHLGEVPVMELVKRGKRMLLIPEGVPEAQLGVLLRQFTRN